MKLASFRYIVPESLQSMRRNLLMTIAAIATVMITLFLCSIFLLLMLNIDANAQDFLSDIEVMAFLDSDVTPVDRVRIESSIKRLEGFDTLTFISKEDAMNMLDRRLSGVLQALEGDNPLPDSYSVTAVSADYVVALAEAIAGITGIEKVRHDQGLTETLISFTDTLRKVGLGVMALLGLAAVVLIAMSTRISVYARQKEIMVMKWIGSTNAFIRWPFLLEGILVGCFGAVLSSVLCFLLYDQAVEYLSGALPFMMFMSALPAVMMIAPAMLLVGLVMGGLGSAISVARFLDV